MNQNKHIFIIYGCLNVCTFHSLSHYYSVKYSFKCTSSQSVECVKKLSIGESICKFYYLICHILFAFMFTTNKWRHVIKLITVGLVLQEWNRHTNNTTLAIWDNSQNAIMCKLCNFLTNIYNLLLSYVLYLTY